MTMTTEQQFAAVGGGHTVKVVQDSEGNTWAGTVYWMVRGTGPNHVVPPATVDKIVAADFTLQLEAATIEGDSRPVLVRPDDHNLMALFRRPDGALVRINDGYLAAIAEWNGHERADGSIQPAQLRLRQSSSQFPLEETLAPVGCFDGDQLVAVVMPVRS